MKITKFEDIIAWQEARKLNNELFKKFENSNNYSFKDQLLRASLSIMNNIAEGFERDTDKDLKRFLYIAKASSAEVRSMLHLAKDFKYINKKDFDNYYSSSVRISKLLSGFIRKLS